MGKMMDAVRKNAMVQGVLMIVFGFLMIVWPGPAIITALYLVAGMLALWGITSVVGYFRVEEEAGRPAPMLVSGVVLLIAALLIVVFPAALASVGSVVLGIVLLFCGVVNAVRSWELRAYADSTWVFSFVVSILIAVGGVVVVVNPFDTAALLVFVLGVCMLVAGVEDVVIEMRARKALKEDRA